MFSIIHILFVAIVASSVSGLIIPRHRSVQLAPRTVTVPSTYASGYLEDYLTYHTRYIAIDCENKHNTTYFDNCCHPLLATENLKDNRPAECAPTAAELSSASAAIATPTADGGDDGCSDGPSSTTHTSKSTPAPENVGAEPPKTTPKATLKATPKASPKKESTTKTHSSSVSKASSTSSSGGGLLSGLGQIFSNGIATFFFQNGVAGACGTVHSDSDFIAAIDQARYGDSGKKSSLCGKKIKVVNTKTNKSVTVTIEDDCPTCSNENSVDLSQAAFNQIGTAEEGEVDIQWAFLD